MPPPWLAQSAQARALLDEAVRDHRGDARADLGREVDRRGHRRVSHAIPVRRVERVDEDAQPGVGGRLEEGQEPRPHR